MIRKIYMLRWKYQIVNEKLRPYNAYRKKKDE